MTSGEKLRSARITTRQDPSTRSTVTTQCHQRRVLKPMGLHDALSWTCTMTLQGPEGLESAGAKPASIRNNRRPAARTALGPTTSESVITPAVMHARKSRTPCTRSSSETSAMRERYDLSSHIINPSTKNAAMSGSGAAESTLSIIHRRAPEPRSTSERRGTHHV